MNEFTHINENGNVIMVDVSDKISSYRMARAEGEISLSPETIKAINDEKIPKGNVITTAKIAGIQSAKRTSELIPMCHQLNLSFIDIKFKILKKSIIISSIVRTKEATGVEMEALSAISASALTIYDMCKAIDKTMVIQNIRLLEKVGGKSNHLTDYRPNVGIITLSDSIFKGNGTDISGPILVNGFLNSGCKVDNQKLLPDGSSELLPTIKNWINEGIELIITTGGTGLGPRDLTIGTLEKIFESRLPGIENALHEFGRQKVKTAMLSRLAVGVINNTILVCLPGSTGAVKDALVVLIPTIFHSFHMLKGEKH
jgi:cyclic pyranopterin monophosphate synthase